jgi:hypothetical protein
MRIFYGRMVAVVCIAAFALPAMAFVSRTGQSLARAGCPVLIETAAGVEAVAGMAPGFRSTKR